MNNSFIKRVQLQQLKIEKVNGKFDKKAYLTPRELMLFGIVLELIADNKTITPTTVDRIYQLWYNESIGGNSYNKHMNCIIHKGYIKYVYGSLVIPKAKLKILTEQYASLTYKLHFDSSRFVFNLRPDPKPRVHK